MPRETETPVRQPKGRDHHRAASTTLNRLPSQRQFIALPYMQPASEPSPRDEGARGAVACGITVLLRSRGRERVSDQGETYRDAASGSRTPSRQLLCRDDSHVVHPLVDVRVAANHGSRVLLALRAVETMTKWSWPPRHATAISLLPSRIGVHQEAHTAPHRASGGVRGGCSQWHIHVLCNALPAPLCFLFPPPRQRHYCTAIFPPAVRALAARYRSYNPLPISWNSPTRRSAPAGSHASRACGKDSLRALALCHQLGRPRRS